MDEPRSGDGTDDVHELTLGTQLGGRSVGTRRRRRQALIVVGAAVASAVGGVAVGSRLKSPADAANARKPPAASLITVPIERRTLVSNLTVAGQIVYDQPTAVRLLGSVGESAGANQVITRLPEIGTPVNEGDRLLEVSGRPVFALQGVLPVFRSLEPGANGPDVLQLETALQRLGFAVGTVDQVYDEGTEQALDALYESRGYKSEGPSEEQRKQLRDTRQRLTEAEEALRKAEADLRAGGTTASPSELLAARQRVNQDAQAVPAAQAAATQANQAAAAEVTSATALRDAARVSRDAARTIAEAAAQPGAINTATGEPYTPIEVAELQATLAEREKELIEAERGITNATTQQASTRSQGERSVSDANDALALSRAQLADLEKPADTAPLQAIVTQATAARDEAATEVFTVEVAVGTKLPAGEVVFLPTVPTQVTDVSTTVGSTVSDVLLTVSSATTQITGRVSKNDADLLKSGSPVTIDVPDFGIQTTGTLSQIGAKTAASNDPNSPDFGNGGSGDSGRVDVIVLPDDPGLLKDFVGSTARIKISVSSTDGEVLAVPVAALTVGPDGSSRVELWVQQTDTTVDAGAAAQQTEMVAVEVGLTAQGYAEISTPDGRLVEGDRVVIGFEEVPSDGNVDDTVPADEPPPDETSAA